MPDETLFSLRLEHDGHSFFAFRTRWMFEYLFRTVPPYFAPRPRIDLDLGTAGRPFDHASDILASGDGPLACCDDLRGRERACLALLTRADVAFVIGRE